MSVVNLHLVQVSPWLVTKFGSIVQGIASGFPKSSFKDGYRITCPPQKGYKIMKLHVMLTQNLLVWKLISITILVSAKLPVLLV